MNKKGFVSTALIYTFFILFLILMVFLLNNYSSKRFLINRYQDDVEEELFELSHADLNLYIFSWSEDDKEYKYIGSLEEVKVGQSFQKDVSFCKNSLGDDSENTNIDSNLSFVNGEIYFKAQRKNYCYVYFK